MRIADLHHQAHLGPAPMNVAERCNTSRVAGLPGENEGKRPIIFPGRARCRGRPLARAGCSRDRPRDAIMEG